MKTSVIKNSPACIHCGSTSTTKAWIIAELLGLVLSVFIITLPLGIIFLFGGLFLFIWPEGRSKRFCSDCKKTFNIKKT